MVVPFGIVLEDVFWQADLVESFWIGEVDMSRNERPWRASVFPSIAFQLNADGNRDLRLSLLRSLLSALLLFLLLLPLVESTHSVRLVDILLSRQKQLIVHHVLLLFMRDQ